MFAEKPDSEAIISDFYDDLAITKNELIGQGCWAATSVLPLRVEGDELGLGPRASKSKSTSATTFGKHPHMSIHLHPVL